MKKIMLDPEHEIKVFSTVDALNIAAAEFIIVTANKCVAEKGKFSISLSGGQTPQALYALLAHPSYRDRMPWNKTLIFWGDERFVAATDKRNNAYQAKLILLSRVNIPPANIHAIPVDILPAQAAIDYEKEITACLGEPPQFDLILLGLGENGHTASLFPMTTVLNERTAYVKELYVEEEKMYRITMTAPLINEASNVLFLVTGQSKAKILKKVLLDNREPEKYPAQLIHLKSGRLLWFVDEEAAEFIER